MMGDTIKKVLTHVTVEGRTTSHMYDIDTPLETLWELASDMLGTPLAIMHNIDTQDPVIRARLFTLRQGEGLPANKHVTDGIMEGMGILTFMEGDVVLMLEPGPAVAY